jgi:hypothetical protein
MTPSDIGGDQSPVEDLEKVGAMRRLPPTEDRPYDPAPFRDKMRAWLALALVGLLALTTLVPFCVIIRNSKPEDRAMAVHDHLGMVFTPLVALVASAVGYYFATRNSDGA